MENQGKASYRGTYIIARGDNELNAPVIVTFKDKFGNSGDIELEETVSIDTELPYIQEISHDGIKPLSAGKKLRVRIIGESMARAKFDISGFKTGLDMYTMTPDMFDPPLFILNWDWKILTGVNRQWLISGRIKNISGTSKDRVKAVITFYDDNGKSIGESFTFTNPRDIPSGVTASFKIYRPYTGDINPKLKLFYGADEKLVGESINDGVYVGDYIVGNNDNIFNAVITCYLTDTAGNQSVIQASEKVSFDTIPPVIISLQHDANKVLVEGDILTVTMESGLSGEPGGIATFDIGDYKKELEMSPADTNGKRFVGIYHIRAGDQADNALIKGYLKDAAGNSTSFVATRPVSINTAIPDITIVSHNAGIRPFIQGETLVVTVHTTPGSIVTFNVDGIPDRPMYDDGLHDDGSARDGLYKGTYVIKKGDNVKNAKVKVKVTSPNGKIAIREALEAISIDTEPPLAINGVVGADRPDDEGGYIILRWNPSTSEDFHHYNIYQSEKPIINLVGLKPLDLEFIESDCSLMDAKCSFITIQYPVSNIQHPLFYFAVTAVDYATNESPVTRESITGTVSSVDNSPPGPVQKVSAHDRAYDNGKVITVVWTEPSSAEDFYRYHIYRSNTPINSTFGLIPVDMGITDRNVLTTQVLVSQDDVDYYFAVTAVDFSGNESKLTKDSVTGPVSSKDNIGIVPDTLVKIISGPIGEIHYDDVTFRWNRWTAQSSEALSGYYYKLDTANWTWTNQTEITYYNLAEGQHTFHVRADLGLGSQDPMPASRIFAIKRVSVSEMESNNNIGSANWISKGMTIFGKSTDDDDKDWYKFHVESSSLITVYFNRYRQIAGSSGTTTLSIYNNFQNVENRIGMFQITKATGQRGSFSVGAELGDYFILVDPQGESPESQYEISVSTSE
ncbi:hypothetical protein FJZ33_05165, partial [Candidatus Poribacteria bacterium]|nr:hypothetical protein [Candidatus Poribacteria bacterium]